MAIGIPAPQSTTQPKKSLWRRLAHRDPTQITPPEIVTPHKDAPTTEKTPHKLRRRGTQVYRDAPAIALSRKASSHLPLAEESTSVPARRSSKREKKPKELITIMKVQRIEVPVRREKPRVISLTRVSASDMRTNPFPASPYIRTVGWSVFLTSEQIYSLVMGFNPGGVDDKWFIFSQGPDQSGKLKIHFHRSWTGLKIAELFVVVDLKGEGAGTIVGIKWNGTDQTNGMDEEEAKYMVSTTCRWVLGVDLVSGALPVMRFE